LGVTPSQEQIPSQQKPLLFSFKQASEEPTVSKFEQFKQNLLRFGDQDTEFWERPKGNDEHLVETFKYCGNSLIHDPTFLWLAGLSLPAIPISKNSVPKWIKLTTNANGLGPVSPDTSIYHLTGSALHKHILPENVAKLIHNTSYKKIFGTPNILGGIGRVAQVPLLSATAAYATYNFGACVCENF
jgi:hypothetical protein